MRVATCRVHLRVVVTVLHSLSPSQSRIAIQLAVGRHVDVARSFCYVHRQQVNELFRIHKSLTHLTKLSQLTNANTRANNS